MPIEDQCFEKEAKVKTLFCKELEGKILVSFTLTTNAFTKHEPIVLTLIIKNESEQEVKMNLGSHQEEAIDVLVTLPTGKILRKPHSIEEGVGSTSEVIIKPDELYTQNILLSKWFRFENIGEYKINVSLDKHYQTNETLNLLANSSTDLKLSVQKNNPKKLDEISNRLLNTIVSAESYKDVYEAALNLSYIKDPVAVPYMERAASTKDVIAPICIKGLERIGSKEAVSALSNLIKHNDEDVSLLARNALYFILNKTKDGKLKKEIKTILSRSKFSHMLFF